VIYGYLYGIFVSIMKILVITPKFPLPDSGACEKDRMSGILTLKRLGFEVRVLAKYFAFQDKNQIDEWGRKHGIAVTLVEYRFKKKAADQSFIKHTNPFHWDGAANEYSDSVIQNAAEELAEVWKPELVWFDYTYLWPLYKIFKSRNIRIVTRSINFEPVHFLQEDGISLRNLAKFFPKVLSEIITVIKSEAVLAITPNEEKIYRILGSRHTSTLPLRGLASVVESEWIPRDSRPLHVFFMGASYNVHHNRKAAELILKKIAPEVERRAPGDFIFHIMGSKLPEEFASYVVGNVRYDGYVPDLHAHLRTMDVALVPSLLGAGMQQKIFEPITLGIPTIVSERGLAGYPFFNGKQVLTCHSTTDFVENVLRMKDYDLRKKLSIEAKETSAALFSTQKIDSIILDALK